MKAIAIVELPDDAFDKGRWYLDKFVYTEKESLFDDYANDMWELKPLPKKMPMRDEAEFYLGYMNGKTKYLGFNEGYNACLEDILGGE